MRSWERHNLSVLNGSSHPPTIVRRLAVVPRLVVVCFSSSGDDPCIDREITRLFVRERPVFCGECVGYLGIEPRVYRRLTRRVSIPSIGTERAYCPQELQTKERWSLCRKPLGRGAHSHYSFIVVYCRFSRLLGLRPTRPGIPSYGDTNRGSSELCDLSRVLPHVQTTSLPSEPRSWPDAQPQQLQSPHDDWALQRERWTN